MYKYHCCLLYANVKLSVCSKTSLQSRRDLNAACSVLVPESSCRTWLKHLPHDTKLLLKTVFFAI